MSNTTTYDSHEHTGSLDYFFPFKIRMQEVIEDKMWYQINSYPEVFECWQEYVNAEGTDAEKQASTKFSDRVLSINVKNDTPDGHSKAPDGLQYVTKWSGGCLADKSGYKGGICLLEENDTPLEVDENSFQTIYNATNYVVGQESNRRMGTYRFSNTLVGIFEDSWEKRPARDPDEGQDGRCYQNSIASKQIDTSDTGMLEYLDYPYCKLILDDQWLCQMYLPREDQASTGYPAFVENSNIAAYYISSYIPGDKESSFTMVEAQLLGAGSLYSSVAACLVCGVLASLLF